MATATGWSASDGGVFTFGAASFMGSMGGRRLNAPVLSMSSSPAGDGYWLVAGDGGVFTFGRSRFMGSTGDLRLNAPVIDMAVHPDGRGYWLYARDGGVFTFGANAFHGSVPGMGLCRLPVTVAMRPTATGNGYWIVTSRGWVIPFGDAVRPRRGSDPGVREPPWSTSPCGAEPPGHSACQRGEPAALARSCSAPLGPAGERSSWRRTTSPMLTMAITRSSSTTGRWRMRRWVMSAMTVVTLSSSEHVTTSSAMSSETGTEATSPGEPCIARTTSRSDTMPTRRISVAHHGQRTDVVRGEGGDDVGGVRPHVDGDEP